MKGVRKSKKLQKVIDSPLLFAEPLVLCRPLSASNQTS
jgi:hypothetical protein